MSRDDGKEAFLSRDGGNRLLLGLQVLSLFLKTAEVQSDSLGVLVFLFRPFTPWLPATLAL